MNYRKIKYWIGFFIISVLSILVAYGIIKVIHLGLMLDMMVVICFGVIMVVVLIIILLFLILLLVGFGYELMESDDE